MIECRCTGRNGTHGSHAHEACARTIVATCPRTWCLQAQQSHWLSMFVQSFPAAACSLCTAPSTTDPIANSAAATTAVANKTQRSPGTCRPHALLYRKTINPVLHEDWRALQACLRFLWQTLNSVHTVDLMGYFRRVCECTWHNCGPVLRVCLVVPACSIHPLIASCLCLSCLKDWQIPDQPPLECCRCLAALACEFRRNPDLKNGPESRFMA